MSKAGPIFSPSRSAIQLATERFIVRPFYLLFKQLSVTGRENIVKDRPMVIVSNHLSLWDPPILSIATQRPICYIAKKELFENPYLAQLIELLGTVAIDRKKPTLSSIKKIKEAVKAGWSLGIFIEGTRSRVKGSMGPPHTGAAYFAYTNNLPILPLGLIDTNKKKGKCYARIGKVIEPGADLEAKTWEIMGVLSELTGYKLPDSRIVDQVQD